MMSLLNNLKIKQKILLINALVVLVVVALLLFANAQVMATKSLAAEQQALLEQTRNLSSFNDQVAELRTNSVIFAQLPIYKFQSLRAAAYQEIGNLLGNTEQRKQAQLQPLVEQFYEQSEQFIRLYLNGENELAVRQIQSAEAIFSELRQSVEALQQERLMALNTISDDVQRANNSLMITLWVIVLLVTLVLIGGGLLTARMINQPLQKMTSTSLNVSQHNDLTVRSDDSRNDEFGTLAGAFNSLCSSVSDIVKDIQRSAMELRDSAAKLSSISQKTGKGANKQTAEIISSSSAIEQMSVSINEVDKVVQQASEAADNCQKETQRGQKAVESTLDAVNVISVEFGQTAELIENLKQESDGIGSILEVITNITDQTNLLALNAAIEAARAGEAGRGFAVVADEVRQLAQRTQESTGEIESLLTRLQGLSNRAVDAVHASTENVASSLNLAEETGQVLGRILNSSRLIAELNTQIAAASIQQSTVAKEMSVTMNGISDIAKETEAMVRDSQQLVTQMDDVSDTLSKNVMRFKV